MIRIFRILIPASVLALFLAEALLIFACFAAIPYFQGNGYLFLFYEFGWQQIAIVEAFMLFGMYFCHLYDDLRMLSRIVFLQQLSLVIGITFVAQALISYANNEMALPRNILIPGSALALVAVFFCRVLFSLAIQNKVGGRRLLFIGVSQTVVQLAHHLRRYPEFGLIPIGYLDHPGAHPLPGDHIARLGLVGDLPVVMEELAPDWIVVSRPEEIEPRWLDDFIELRFSGMHTERAASLYETALGRVCASEIRPDVLVFSEPLQPNPLNLKLQSFYSKALAVIAVGLTLPLIAVLAMVIKIRSRGPLLVRESRVGMNGEPFTMYRFHWTPADGSAGLGRFLSERGLDAYPQFWNVLRGEMSVVGPAPDRPEFAAQLNAAIPFHVQRTAVKPGMTGWAQIHDSRLGLRRDAMGRLEYDLYYVKNLSPSLDLSVLLRWLRELTFGNMAAA